MQFEVYFRIPDRCMKFYQKGFDLLKIKDIM